MKLVFLLLILFNQNVFAWSLFGYSSFSDCMKEEIKDNNGKENSFIRNYCREKFPKKTSSYVSLAKKWGSYKSMPRKEYDIESIGGKVTLTNKSKEKTIVMLRMYYFYSDDCPNSDLKIKKENYSYKNVRVGPGQSNTYTFFDGNNTNCFYSRRDLNNHYLISKILLQIIILTLSYSMKYKLHTNFKKMHMKSVSYKLFSMEWE